MSIFTDLIICVVILDHKHLNQHHKDLNHFAIDEITPQLRRQKSFESQYENVNI